MHVSSVTREEILETLSGVFEEVLDRPIELRDETTAADVEGWDSIVNVLLIVATERQFGVRFESSELANLATVGEFVTLIASKLG
jgi:acyl carrier protein